MKRVGGTHDTGEKNNSKEIVIDEYTININVDEFFERLQEMIKDTKIINIYKKKDEKTDEQN